MQWLCVDRVLPDTGVTTVSSPSGSQFSPKELEELNVELDLPALETVIPKNELRSLNKEQKKWQEVINGNATLICYVRSQ